MSGSIQVDPYKLYKILVWYGDKSERFKVEPVYTGVIQCAELIMNDTKRFTPGYNCIISKWDGYAYVIEQEYYSGIE